MLEEENWITREVNQISNILDSLKKLNIDDNILITALQAVAKYFETHSEQSKDNLSTAYKNYLKTHRSNLLLDLEADLRKEHSVYEPNEEFDTYLLKLKENPQFTSSETYKTQLKNSIKAQDVELSKKLLLLYLEASAYESANRPINDLDPSFFVRDAYYLAITKNSVDNLSPVYELKIQEFIMKKNQALGTDNTVLASVYQLDINFWQELQTLCR